MPDSEVYFSEEDGKIIIEKETPSFTEWAEKISSDIGQLEKDIKSYRREQLEERFS